MKPDIGSGDLGETDVTGGGRVAKDSPLMEALGSIDEATSAIGLARALVENTERKELLLWCQKALSACGAEIAGDNATGFDFTEGARRAEHEMRRLGETYARPTCFVMPGESVREAALNVARAVVRRAERNAVALTRAGVRFDMGVIKFLNRLSDLLFDLACAWI